MYKNNENGEKEKINFHIINIKNEKKKYYNYTKIKRKRISNIFLFIYFFIKYIILL